MALNYLKKPYPREVKHNRQVFKEQVIANKEKLLRKAVGMALDGDPIMLKMLLERLLPAKPSSDTIDIELDDENLVGRTKQVVAALGRAEITVTEAETVMRTLFLQSKIIEAKEIEEIKRDVLGLKKAAGIECATDVLSYSATETQAVIDS